MKKFYEDQDTTDLTCSEIEMIKEQLADGFSLDDIFVGAYWSGLEDVATSTNQISEVDWLAIFED